MSNGLYKYIAGFSDDVKIEILKILKSIEKDPGITYHMYSKTPPKFRWPSEHIPRKPPPLLKKMSGAKVKLPNPDRKLLDKSLPEILLKRHSVRDFEGKPLTIIQLSTLLYFTVGIKGYEWGYPMRIFPSAGALQPVETYVAVEHVLELDPGIYHYEPDGHILVKIKDGRFNHELYRYTLEQTHVRDAAINIMLTVIYGRTASKYGFRAYRYVSLDTGHIGMNIYLVATALGLGTCAVGAFEDRKINDVLDVDEDEFTLLIYPVGYEKRG